MFPPALTVRHLLRGYAESLWRPSDVMRETLARVRAADDPAIWIAMRDAHELRARAVEMDRLLAAQGPRLLAAMPLLGVPFAVKDNIDVAGLATTVACPEIAFHPQESATTVARLEAAGAIALGKTNLDQLATGLVGARSPYGAVRNPFAGAYISGGSSSGSAAAVARGLVPFALGTDTAGSGRVPAGFCNLVGLKPTRGLVSCHGVFPACRTLDCVSVFALDVADAWAVLTVIAGADPHDSFSRHVPQAGPLPRGVRLGVPEPLEFFGDAVAETAFRDAVATLRDHPLVRSMVQVDFAPFAEVARLLYQGSWVAERRAALGERFGDGCALEPTVRGIVAAAEQRRAVDAFRDIYRLADLRMRTETALREIDILLVPTAPTIYTIDAVRQDPITLNTNLGHYTNFANLLDMSALAIPAGFRPDGLPVGVTLLAPAGSDHRLAEFARRIEPALHARLGITSTSPEPAERLAPLTTGEAMTRVAVVGAHLAGEPLDWQLIERSARLVASTTSAPEYRLYALPGTVPPKPGLVRVSEGGVVIEVEVWEMPLRHFGSFVAGIAAPLGIGSVRLADGTTVQGFVCEAWATAGAQDISDCGGWRAYLRARAGASLRHA